MLSRAQIKPKLGKAKRGWYFEFFIVRRVLDMKRPLFTQADHLYDKQVVCCHKVGSVGISCLSTRYQVYTVLSGRLSTRSNSNLIG